MNDNPPRRHGFTLVELVVSVVILRVTVVALLRFGGLFARANSDATARSVASRIASRRLEEVRRTTRYFLVESFVESNAIPPGFADYRRRTQVLRIGGSNRTDVADYKVVTVTVTSSRLPAAVIKTTAPAPKNLMATSRATEESAETEAISVGVRT